MRQQGGNGLGRHAGERSGSRYDVHDAQEFDLQPLSKLKFKLLGSTAADLHEAENAVWDLNQRTEVLESRVLADAMLNIEAMASVRMDGRQPSAGDLFFELAGASLGARELTDATIRFQRDRASLEHTLGLGASACSVDAFKSIHESVLPPRHESSGGKLRSDLKQVGGSRYHAFGSVYTMPRPEAVPGLLDDLAAFLNEESMPVVEQAGIVHAQLINIHPFERGNGKMARAVVHFTFRYRGIATRYLLPITTVIVNASHDYVAGINACRFDGSEPEEQVNDSMNAWVSFFSNTCLKAANVAARFATACEGIQAENERRAKSRKGSAAQAIVLALPALPVFSVQMMTDYAGGSFKRVSEACKLLEQEGVLKLEKQVKRNRIYYSEEVLSTYLQIDALR